MSTRELTIGAAYLKSADIRGENPSAHGIIFSVNNYPKSKSDQALDEIGSLSGEYSDFEGEPLLQFANEEQLKEIKEALAENGCCKIEVNLTECSVEGRVIQLSKAEDGRVKSLG